MKKTLLILSLIALGFTTNAQVFNTGTISFNNNFSASISISGVTNKTTLTLTVPSNVWFSVGFGGNNMNSGADIFRSNGTQITDAKTTGRFLPPADAQQDWNLESNNVSGGIRTMVVTRDNNTGDSDDFVFNPSTGSLTLIWAHGNGTTNYGYHSTFRGATATSVLSAADVNRIDFDVFPNPATDDVTIQLPSEESEVNLQFYDYIGKLVATKRITNVKNTFSVSDLASGVYILKIVSGAKIGTRKFVKK